MLRSSPLCLVSVWARLTRVDTPVVLLFLCYGYGVSLMNINARLSYYLFIVGLPTEFMLEQQHWAKKLNSEGHLF